MMTDVCNLCCAHCYKRRDTVIARDVEECLIDVKKLIEQGHVVNPGGAETLTNPDYLQVYRLAKQKYLLSNGINFASDADLARKAYNFGIREVRISWNIGAHAIFDRVDENIIRLAIQRCIDAGIIVRVGCVICNTNFDMVADVIAPRVIESGAKILRLIQLIPLSEEMKKYQLSKAQKEVVFSQVKKLWLTYLKEVLYVDVYGNFSSVDLTPRKAEACKKGTFCPAGNDFIVIETNNSIYPCHFLNEERFRIGIWQGGEIILHQPFINGGSSCAAEKIYCTHTIPA
jgi:MoaA/NifB/PqqE/SkfB family radical SAM enzyme